jgi:hypothetical protein
MSKMAMTVNGISTTTELGQEQWETIKRSYGGRQRKTYVSYDYRHTNGRLFSCVKPTLEACRSERDKWIANQ